MRKKLNPHLTRHLRDWGGGAVIECSDAYKLGQEGGKLLGDVILSLEGEPKPEAVDHGDLHHADRNLEYAEVPDEIHIVYPHPRRRLVDHYDLGAGPNLRLVIRSADLI